MSTEQFDTLLDRYLSEAMSPMERQNFEAHLASEPELSKLVAADQLIRRTFASSYPDRQSMASTTLPAAALLQYLEVSRPARRLSVFAFSSISIFVSLLGLVVYMTLSRDVQPPSSTATAVDSARTITRSVPLDTVTMQPPALNALSRPSLKRLSRAVRRTETADEKLNERLGPPKVYPRDSFNIQINTK